MTGRYTMLSTSRAQGNDGQTYIGEGKSNAQPVKVLQDTGCTGMIVERALVPDCDTRQFRFAAEGDHTLTDVPLANVYFDSPYYKEHCRVM